MVAIISFTHPLSHFVVCSSFLVLSPEASSCLRHVARFLFDFVLHIHFDSFLGSYDTPFISAHTSYSLIAPFGKTDTDSDIHTTFEVRVPRLRHPLDRLKGTSDNRSKSRTAVGQYCTTCIYTASAWINNHIYISSSH